MKTIGIIGAMEVEVAILKENMEDQIVLTIEDQDITFEKKSIASARLSLDF